MAKGDKKKVVGMTYAGTGVSYENMDPFKLACQKAARETDGNIARLNNGEFQVFEESRGESAFLIKAAKSYFGHVEEGLGTKNLVADAMYALNKDKSFYDQVAQCTVAMIVNDLATLGVLPLSVAMHLAVGDSAWFDDTKRSQDLIDGWKHACDLARCVWGGGETPTLQGIIMPGTVLLSGSAMGLVKPKENLITPENICAGDAIVFIGSSGIHANCLTMARKIADKLPNGYLTRVHGHPLTYGELLLKPTEIYVGLVEDCINADVDIHYAVNITGHGWRKLMRAKQSFAYNIHTLPFPNPLFAFMQKYGPIDDVEAYGNLNMGAGFALYVPEKDIDTVQKIAKSNSLHAWWAGTIEHSLEKKVVIAPLGIEYSGQTLQVR